MGTQHTDSLSPALCINAAPLPGSALSTASTTSSTGGSAAWNSYTKGRTSRRLSGFFALPLAPALLLWADSVLRGSSRAGVAEGCGSGEGCGSVRLPRGTWTGRRGPGECKRRAPVGPSPCPRVINCGVNWTSLHSTSLKSREAKSTQVNFSCVKLCQLNFFLPFSINAEKIALMLCAAPKFQDQRSGATLRCGIII